MAGPVVDIDKGWKVRSTGIREQDVMTFGGYRPPDLRLGGLRGLGRNACQKSRAGSRAYAQIFFHAVTPATETRKALTELPKTRYTVPPYSTVDTLRAQQQIKSPSSSSLLEYSTLPEVTVCILRCEKFPYFRFEFR